MKSRNGDRPCCLPGTESTAWLSSARLVAPTLCHPSLATREGQGDVPAPCARRRRPLAVARASGRLRGSTGPDIPRGAYRAARPRSRDRAR